MVDNLEEEHLRREVFTTANENLGQLSENPMMFESQQTSQGVNTPYSGIILKPNTRKDSLLKSFPDMANMAKAEEKKTSKTREV